MRLSLILDPKLCSLAIVSLFSGLVSLSSQDSQDPDFGQGKKGNQSETTRKRNFNSTILELEYQKAALSKETKQTLLFKKSKTSSIF